MKEENKIIPLSADDGLSNIFFPVRKFEKIFEINFLIFSSHVNPFIQNFYK
jgi:hypothetical protein